MNIQAMQRINFMCHFLDDPEGLCLQDWELWHPLIAQACLEVKNEDLRKKGIEVINFFNSHFYKKGRSTNIKPL